MKFILSLAILLTSVSALTAPLSLINDLSIPNLDDLCFFDPYECSCLGEGCHFDYNSGSSQEICSCNDNPDNELPLAIFYTISSFRGFVYQAFGTYGECQSLPGAWYELADSFSSITIPGIETICCIYTADDCNELGYEWMQADDFTIADFEGDYSGGVRSFRCSAFNGLGSNCLGLATKVWNGENNSH